jgi:hypothetical protein
MRQLVSDSSPHTDSISRRGGLAEYRKQEELGREVCTVQDQRCKLKTNDSEIKYPMFAIRVCPSYHPTATKPERRVRLVLFLNRRIISHFCSKWRAVLLDNVEFWRHLHIHAGFPPTYLESCLLHNKQASIFARLHLSVDVATDHHTSVNGSPSITVLRTLMFKPVIFKLEVPHAIFHNLHILEEIQSIYRTGSFDVLRSLNMYFQPFFPSDTVTDIRLALPGTRMHVLTTLRLRGVEVDWSISHAFHRLRILVLWDMDHCTTFRWTDFHNPFAGAPNLQKLAIANVCCSDIPVLPRMPRLASLTNVYVSFGSDSSLKHVLCRMR